MEQMVIGLGFRLRAIDTFSTGSGDSKGVNKDKDKRQRTTEERSREHKHKKPNRQDNNMDRTGTAGTDGRADRNSRGWLQRCTDGGRAKFGGVANDGSDTNLLTTTTATATAGCPGSSSSSWD
jgi:hypothetical protein